MMRRASIRVVWASVTAALVIGMVAGLGCSKRGVQKNPTSARPPGPTNTASSKTDALRAEYVLAYVSKDTKKRMAVVRSNQAAIPEMVKSTFEMVEAGYRIPTTWAMKLPDGTMITPMVWAEAAEAAARDYVSVTGDAAFARDADRRLARVRGAALTADVLSCYKAGDYAEVIAKGNQARVHFQKAAAHEEEAMVLQYVGVAQLKTGQPESALASFNEVMKILDQGHWPEQGGKCYEQMAAAYLDLGRNAEAIRCLEGALKCKKEEGDRAAEERLRGNIDALKAASQGR